MPKSVKKTIEGTRFQCTLCTGKGSSFVAGSRGIDALRERVKEHWGDTGHSMILPVTPRPGMFYVDARTGKRIGEPFKEGQLVGDWLESIRAEVGNRDAEPSWELSHEEG